MNREKYKAITLALIYAQAVAYYLLTKPKTEDVECEVLESELKK